jgi:hypothetical protein
MGPQQMTVWRELDAIQDVFVGPRGAFGPGDIDALGQRLGTRNPSKLQAFSDERILEALATQADSRFALVGWRRMLDTETARDLRTARGREGLDPTPSANDLRAALFGIARPAGPASDPLWLEGLGVLSMPPQEAPFPAVTTKAWTQRMEGTQLASWAQLRHDTMLYAEPLALQARDALTAGSIPKRFQFGAICAYPDVYVDPYPAFYDALSAMAARMQAGVEAVAPLSTAPYLHDWIRTFLGDVSSMAAGLRIIAERQLAGEPPAAGELAWINQAVIASGRACGFAFFKPHLDGWYASPLADIASLDPTVADCSPEGSADADAGGPRVPHIGTGLPRLLVVAVPADGTTSLYFGAVSSFSEVATTQGRRLSDADFARATVHDR